MALDWVSMRIVESYKIHVNVSMLSVLFGFSNVKILDLVYSRRYTPIYSNESYSQRKLYKTHQQHSKMVSRNPSSILFFLLFVSISCWKSNFKNLEMYE